MKMETRLYLAGIIDIFNNILIDSRQGNKQRQ